MLSYPEDSAGRLMNPDVVTVRATYGAPHHVVADGDVLAHRRTRAGDAHTAGERPTTPRTPQGSTTLGMPAIGAPAPLEPVWACGVAR